MPRWAVIENIVTLCATTVLVLGLYHMGAEAWSFCGLALMINLNTPRPPTEGFKS
jgi:hypothetical protein